MLTWLQLVQLDLLGRGEHDAVVGLPERDHGCLRQCHLRRPDQRSGLGRRLDHLGRVRGAREHTPPPSRGLPAPIPSPGSQPSQKTSQVGWCPTSSASTTTSSSWSRAARGAEGSTRGTASTEHLNQQEQVASPQVPPRVPGPPQTHHSLRLDAQNPASEFYNGHLGACPVLHVLKEGAGGTLAHVISATSPVEIHTIRENRCTPLPRSSGHLLAQAQGKASGFPIPTGFKDSR